MSKIRTFIAIEVPPAVQDRLLALIERLRAASAVMKWVDRRAMHLTLNFLGEIDERQIHEVCRAVAEAAASVDPFEIACRGVGAFPNADRPRTVWVGVEEGAEALCQLQSAVASKLAQLGFPREKRKFHPHLTLGRIRHGGAGGDELRELIDRHRDYRAGEADVDEVVVFSSALERGGPIHTPLSHAELGAR